MFSQQYFQGAFLKKTDNKFPPLAWIAMVTGTLFVIGCVIAFLCRRRICKRKNSPFGKEREYEKIDYQKVSLPVHVQTECVIENEVKKSEPECVMEDGGKDLESKPECVVKEEGKGLESKPVQPDSIIENEEKKPVEEKESSPVSWTPTEQISLPYQTRSVDNKLGLFLNKLWNRYRIYRICHLETASPNDNLILNSRTSKINVPTKVENVGEIYISLGYKPRAGRLTVGILAASKLLEMDVIGKSDPYVKLSLYKGKKRLKKKKTTIKKCTLNPVYNQAFKFKISSKNIGKVALVISVVDYDRFKKSELIGKVVLASSTTGDGQKHWNEMLSKPRQQISQWHVLQDLSK